MYEARRRAHSKRIEQLALDVKRNRFFSLRKMRIANPKSRSGLGEVRMRVPGASPSIECVVRDTRRLALDELKALKPNGDPGSSDERRTDYHRQPCRYQARCIRRKPKKTRGDCFAPRPRRPNKMRLGFLCRFAGDRSLSTISRSSKHGTMRKPTSCMRGSSTRYGSGMRSTHSWAVCSTPASIVSSVRNE
jgi:hypothetical protein